MNQKPEKSVGVLEKVDNMFSKAADKLEKFGGKLDNTLDKVENCQQKVIKGIMTVERVIKIIVKSLIEAFLAAFGVGSVLYVLGVRSPVCFCIVLGIIAVGTFIWNLLGE